MKKYLISAAAVGLFALGAATHASAGSQDAYPTIPDECSITIEQTNGPARAAHSVAGPVQALPDCSTIKICIELPAPPPEPTVTPTPSPDAGPGRAPHIALPLSDCTGIDDACHLAPEARGVGASRVVHQPAELAPEPIVIPVLVTQDCQEVLFGSEAAIPGTGSDNTPIMLIAAGLVAAGGLLLIGQRRFARR